jgi:hypothetical protein
MHVCVLAGLYNVYGTWLGGTLDRATNTKIAVMQDSVERAVVRVNQQNPSAAEMTQNKADFQFLMQVPLNAGLALVVVSDEGADGRIVCDAFYIEHTSSSPPTTTTPTTTTSTTTTTTTLSPRLLLESESRDTMLTPANDAFGSNEVWRILSKDRTGLTGYHGKNSRGTALVASYVFAKLSMPFDVIETGMCMCMCMIRMRGTRLHV